MGVWILFFVYVCGFEYGVRAESILERGSEFKAVRKRISSRPMRGIETFEIAEISFENVEN